jgi:hypothetical protein
MPFDAQLAIAALDFNGFGYSDHPDLSVLRARYPELGFVFDRLEDLQELSDTVDKQIEEAVDYEVNPLKEEIDALECRVQDMRLAFEQIRELTVDVEINHIIEDVL